MPFEPPPKNSQMGVYRIYDAANPESASLFAYSRNVGGTIKRLTFELTLNACPNKQFQQFYNSCKQPTIELYEPYTPPSPDMDDIELDAHLQARVLAAQTGHRK